MRSNIYANNAIIKPSYHAKTRWQKGYSWAHWLWWFQNSPHTIDKSGKSIGENSYNKSWRIGLSVVAFKALLELK